MKQTTIILDDLSARILGKVLRDPRIKNIAIPYYDAAEVIDELLRQLPGAGEVKREEEGNNSDG